MSVIDDRQRGIVDAASGRAVEAGARFEAESAGARESEQRRDARGEMAIALGDAFLQERIVGTSDLLPTNFLDRGAAAARTVCRIEVRDRVGRVLGHGTGFLVGRDLIMTNNHVLEAAEDAERSLAQFDYEDDAAGRPRASVTFELDPSRLFLTDKNLDYSLVAVRPTSLDGKPVSTYGYNVLIAESGKALLDEFVNVVQHPMGGPKQVAVRGNKVVAYPGDFVHYETDTNPGSSGSPVYNDQWWVVALHHSGVARKDAQGNYLQKGTGLPITGRAPRDDEVDYYANEGVRISSIAKHVRARGDLAEPTRALATSVFRTLDDVIAQPDAGLVAGRASDISGRTLVEVQRLSADHYEGREGYQLDFLGSDVPRPQVRDSGDVAPVDGSPDGELKYTHFSVVMSKSRRVALYTACNIDGEESVEIARAGGKEKWFLDGRVDDAYQTDDRLYAKNDLDRGHLVRREDPNWGEDADQANDDTFHFTNCSPQHKDLNQKTWLGLENFILKTARERRVRVSVFTGPVFRDDDLVYRGVKIPAEFWKVVVTRHGSKLAAAAYLQSQRNMLDNLEFAYGAYRTYSVPVAKIEELSGLDFGDLRECDRLSSTEERESLTPQHAREVLDPESELGWIAERGA